MPHQEQILNMQQYVAEEQPQKDPWKAAVRDLAAYHTSKRLLLNHKRVSRRDVLVCVKEDFKALKLPLTSASVTSRIMPLTLTRCQAKQGLIASLITSIIMRLIVTAAVNTILAWWRRQENE